LIEQLFSVGWFTSGAHRKESVVRGCLPKFIICLIGIGLILSPSLVRPARAQLISDTSSTTSESIDLRGPRAQTWSAGNDNIIRLEGPVTIAAEHTLITADNAVVWLTPIPNALLGEQQVDIALVGHANLQQDSITRSGDSLFVTLNVRGAIRLTVADRQSIDMSSSALYQAASLIRPADHFAPGTAPSGAAILSQQLAAATQPLPPPTTQKLPNQPLQFTSDHFESTQTAEGKVAFVLTGNVTIYQSRAKGDFLECQCDRAVLFTPRNSVRGMTESNKVQAAEEAVTAAYLEGDVRLTYTPAPPAQLPFQTPAKPKGEQRLTGDRVYYDFTTDRAVLTDAILHTVDPSINIPMVVRAQLLQQMSVGEYQTHKVELTTSQFVVPSYSIKAQNAYVRMVDTGDPRYGVETQYVAHDATLRAYGVPYLYFPTLTGKLTQRGSTLRSIYTESNSRFGTGVRSTWGFFETFGILPPDDLDAQYHLDYLSGRGFGTGLDGSYEGGFIDETTKLPWDFQGKFTSYFVADHGVDRLGADRGVVDPDRNYRGDFLWEHQHFFPDDWQAQIRLGYATDPTFLEEWYQNQFDTAQPYDASVYLKHQHDTEAFTFLTEVPTRRFITNGDEEQEQTQVLKYPEIGYQRIGDSLGDDNFTFFSQNSLSALSFKPSDVPLADLGFVRGETPGLPSYSETGETERTNIRGDSRQEVDYPVQLGQFKMVPFIFGRYTGYTESPQNKDQNRFFGGTGVRMSTDFWKVDDTAESDLWDIHRMRHIIEPQLTLFTSGSTVPRQDIYDYDEDTDKLNDVTGAQLALDQTWQTKRGGAGQFRSVDFFTLNVEANLFTHQPSSALLNPVDFRGLFFPSEPEISIPRNSINADSLWRVSDTTAILGDEEYNLDHNTLATASIGAAFQRDVRLAYFLGLRYIGDINSTVATAAVNYQLSLRYSISASESIDVASQKSEDSSLYITRHFDRFFGFFELYYDQINQQSGFRIGVIPEGVAKGVSSDQVGSALGGNPQ
jgi:lipopolysaccharide export system protein LptA